MKTKRIGTMNWSKYRRRGIFNINRSVMNASLLILKDACIIRKLKFYEKLALVTAHFIPGSKSDDACSQHIFKER